MKNGKRSLQKEMNECLARINDPTIKIILATGNIDYYRLRAIESIQYSMQCCGPEHLIDIMNELDKAIVLLASVKATLRPAIADVS